MANSWARPGVKPIPEAVRGAFSYDAMTGEIVRVASLKPRYIGKSAARALSERVRHLYVHFEGQNYSAHRVAWFLHYGEQPPPCLDHINGDGRDNRIANIRAATCQQNTWNRPSPKKRSALPKGVVARAYGRFEANINENGKRRYIGSFGSPEDASKAYQAAATKLHGDFLWGRK